MNLETLKQALNVIEDGLLIVNRDYIIEYANEPAKKLLRKSELEGKTSYSAIWDKEKIEGKSPSFMTFDTSEISSAEKNFEDGTCLTVRSYPFDENHIVLTIWDITEFVTLERRLEQAGTDRITGLRSDSHFATDLEKEFDRAKRTKSGLSFILLEMRMEKEETEEEHDEKLRQVSKILVETARNYDIIYRLYSDTFGIILPHCDPDIAKKTAEKMVELIRKAVKNVKISIGISGSRNAFTGRDTVRLAERALYVAKHRGGNTCVVG